MAKRTVHFRFLLGPGVTPVDRAWIEIAPSYEFVDGTAVNWPLPKRYELEDGEVTVTGMEDTFLGEDLVWAFRPVQENARGQVLAAFPATKIFPTGDAGVTVEYDDLIDQDPIGIPGFGPTWAVQAEAAALVATDAAADALAAKAATEAVGATNDTIIAGRINTAGSATDTALKSTIGAVSVDAVTEAAQSSESDLNSVLNEIALAALGIGTDNLAIEVDATSDLSIPRPAGFLGHVYWQILTGSEYPVHYLSPKDRILRRSIVEIPWDFSLLSNTKLVMYDAITLASSLALGSAVASWTDLSGNGAHAVQATAGQRPILTANAIGTHPGVVADGADDKLIATLVSDYTGSFTVYFVVNATLADNTASVDYLWDFATAAGTVGQGSLYRSTTEAYTQQRGTTLVSAVSAWATGKKVGCAVYDGATSTLTIDGTVVASGSLQVSQTLHFLSLFGRYDTTANGMAGALGFFCAVQGLVNSAEHTKAMNYLNTRWA